MGLCKQKFNFRFGAETVRKLLELQDMLWPWCPTMTSTVERLVDLDHFLFTEGRLEQALEAMQEKHRGTSWYTQSSSQGEAKPGPLRASRPTQEHGRPGLVSHHFAATSANAGLGPLKRYHAFGHTPFLGEARLRRRIA